MTNALKLVAEGVVGQMSIEGTKIGDRDLLQKILHPAYHLVSQAASNWNDSTEAIAYLEQSTVIIKEAIVFLSSASNQCPDEFAFPRLLTLSQALRAIAIALSAYWSDDKGVDDALIEIGKANKYLGKSL
jgi:hypothetical protein